jgi:DNA sulfur modification protein DndE
MIDNPAYTEDAPLLTQLKTIGIEPGGDFDLSQFNASTQEAMINIPAGVQTAFDGMTASPPPGNLQNGWNVNTSGLGNYGTEYSVRAYVTKIGYGANQAVDAIYPNTAVDGDGQNLSGSHKYVLHFDAESMPPVRGFWSLTMYDKRGFLVDNAIDRYNLGSMKELTYNSDGSLDLLIQSTPPTGNEANWLPSPPPGEEFELTFRMYYPEEVVIDREFVMPAVERVN